MLNKFCLILSISIIFCSIIPAFAAEETKMITAPAGVLMEAQTGKILYENNPHEQRPCASVTKVMTLLLVFEAIDSGKIKLTIEKGGKTFAQIKNGNKYGEKLPIKRETFARGNDPVQMANAMQMRAIQEQMQEISCQIESIDHSVREVIQGQQNDRIALYYSGVALYLEACKVNDQEMRKALIAQALRGLSESTFQLTLKIQDDIKFLSDKKYDNDKKHRADTIRERMQSIEQSFSFIHQASMLRAAIYCKEGELQAMSSVLSEYSHFIGGTIAPNAQLLAECDKNDSGTERGTWKSRKNLELDVTELVKRLDAPRKTLYLSMAQEAEEKDETD